VCLRVIRCLPLCKLIRMNSGLIICYLYKILIAVACINFLLPYLMSDIDQILSLPRPSEVNTKFPFSPALNSKLDDFSENSVGMYVSQGNDENGDLIKSLR
jgi:hypothetical protein